MSAGILAGGVQAAGIVSAIGVSVWGDIAKGVVATGRYFVSGVRVTQLDNIALFVGIVAAAVGAMFLASLHGFLALRRNTAPWSRGNFRAVLAALAIVALGMVTFFVPNLPTFQPVPAMNRRAIGPAQRLSAA